MTTPLGTPLAPFADALPVPSGWSRRGGIAG